MRLKISHPFNRRPVGDGDRIVALVIPGSAVHTDAGAVPVGRAVQNRRPPQLAASYVDILRLRINVHSLALYNFVRSREKTMRGIGLTLTAAVALIASGVLVDRLQAAPIAPSEGLRAALGRLDIVEKAQVLGWDGRRYCWYDDGWQGPGFYWCGYAWRQGFGWGGGSGWDGWEDGRERRGRQQQRGRQQ